MESPQLIQCVNPDGSFGASYIVNSAGVKSIDLSNQRLAVVSNAQDSLNVEVFDRTTGMLQSSSFPVTGLVSLIDNEFSSDGQFYLSYEESDVITLLSISGDGRESVNEISRYPGYGEEWRSIYFTANLGKISADALGNIYVLSESWGEGQSSGTSYRSVRSVIMRRTPSGELSNVVFGHLSKFHYEQNGECVKRCDGFSGAKVLTDLAAQSDGRLITAWADSSVGIIVGDFGGGALVPYRKSVIVAAYESFVSE